MQLAQDVFEFFFESLVWVEDALKSFLNDFHNVSAAPSI